MPLTLPQCYLADLPGEAELTPALVREAWLSVQRNRDHHLAQRATSSILQDLESAAALWMARDSAYLRLALDLGPSETGFSAPIIETGLRQLFGSLNLAPLEAWIEQDLGHPQRLETFCATGPERASHRRSKAVGPAALAHLSAGNLPVAGVLSLVSGLVVRSAQFLKCARGGSLIPRLFAHSLREINPSLAACLEIAEWPRGRSDLNDTLIEGADCVTLSGSDEAVAALRQRVPVTKRLVAYGHRVSFAFVAADAVRSSEVEALAARVAWDVCCWNQQGCLSPHVVYVQEGGAVSAEGFAQHLATALDRVEPSHPRGPIPDTEAAGIRSRRNFYEVRAAASRETRLWQSHQSTAWTVVYEADPQFQASCLNRFVYVKGVDTLETALQGADRVRRHVSTVGLAASAARAPELAARLAEWGVTRICPPGRMQDPPLMWRHDGRPALAALVGWTDWEEAGPGTPPPALASR